MKDLDHITITPDALPREVCDRIVARIRADQASLHPGQVGGGVFPELKHSRDITLTGNAAWQDVEQTLNMAMLGALIRYLREYPSALISPLMLQLLFVYFALPFVPVIGVRLPDFPAAVVAFALNYAAYFAEIFRAGIKSVDRGQYEGAKVLGMTYAQTMRRIVLPQMWARILPPVSNETITLVKDTSLIYVLALNDLLRVARGVVQRDFSFTPFIVAAAFYLIMTLVLTWGFQHLEKKYAKYEA